MSIIGDIYIPHVSVHQYHFLQHRKQKTGVLGRLFHVFRANMDSNNSSSTLSTQVTLQLGDTMAENKFRNEWVYEFKESSHHTWNGHFCSLEIKGKPARVLKSIRALQIKQYLEISGDFLSVEWNPRTRGHLFPCIVTAAKEQLHFLRSIIHIIMLQTLKSILNVLNQM